MASEEKLCGSCKRSFREENDFLQNTDQWRVCTSGNLWFNCNCGSTLMLPRGKFPWYSPEKTMGSDAATIFNVISKKNELPHLPAAVMQLQQLLAKEDVDISELVNAVKQDPFIAAEIVRVCENMRRVRDDGPKNQDPSLEYAITFIGKKQLASLVMVASMKQFKFSTKKFNASRFWDDSFKTAAISEFLWSKQFSNFGKDKAYLAGCLANIGKIVTAIAYPNKMDQIWEQIQDPKTQATWTTIEKELSMPDHCLLGEIGAAFWGFPNYVIETIKNHHAPGEAGELSDDKLCHVVALANILTHWINLEPHRFDEKTLEQERDFFKLSLGEVEQFVEELGNTFS